MRVPSPSPHRKEHGMEGHLRVVIPDQVLTLSLVKYMAIKRQCVAVMTTENPKHRSLGMLTGWKAI